MCSPIHSVHAVARLAALSAGLLCAHAVSHAALDPATDRQVGGVFSNTCGDRSQVMIRLYGDVLDIERAGVAVKANRLQVSKSPPGGAPVPDFKAVVRGEVKGGDGVVLLLTHNAKGLFVRIDGGAKSLAPLGPGVIGQLIRHCDPNRNALPGAAAAAPAGPNHPSDLLKDTRFKAAYLKALGPLAREPWLARLNGPAPEIKKVQAGGAEQLLAAPCKPHDCGDHNLLLLYDPASAAVVGKVFQQGRSTLIGDPTPALARELDRLWREAFRR